MRPAIRAALLAKGVPVNGRPRRNPVLSRGPKTASILAPGPIRRHWRPDQLGTRALVVIRCRVSEFNGLEAEGYRTRSPADGWKVRLVRPDGERLEMFGPEMFFGAAAVEVDIPIRPLPEAAPPFPTRKRDAMCEAAARSAEVKRQATRAANRAELLVSSVRRAAKASTRA
ncbi:MAG: hypothetical protein V1790_17730 [Planctomycetota bacterium]